MEILLVVLITWLANNYDFEINETPAVEIRTQQEIKRMYGRDAYAIYDPHNETIYFLDTVDLESAQGKSIVVHELVHHYQNISGAMDSYSCMQEAERLAYTIQKEYLVAHNGQMMAELSLFNIAMNSFCNDLGY